MHICRLSHWSANLPACDGMYERIIGIRPELTIVITDLNKFVYAGWCLELHDSAKMFFCVLCKSFPVGFLKVCIRAIVGLNFVERPIPNVMTIGKWSEANAVCMAQSHERWSYREIW